MPLAVSVLDLVPVLSGSSAVDALARLTDLARLADRLGYTRYWLAEHHNIPSIASSAPEVLIGHVASATERIRVGSGGVMLPNHSPLLVAERYKTLAALYDNRIDLGIGRAPGADRATMAAVRPFDAEQFPEQLAELTGLSRGDLPEGHPFRAVRAIPDGVALPPVWILGSSGASARLAAMRGMGYSFAAHFSATPAAPAVRAYREAFVPSDEFPEPHVILGTSVVCAPTDEEADRLAGPMDLSWLRFHRGDIRPLPSLAEAEAYAYTPQERAFVEGNRARHIVGSPETVRARLTALAAEAGADEVIVTTQVHDPADRLRSYELLAEAMGLG